MFLTLYAVGVTILLIGTVILFIWYIVKLNKYYEQIVLGSEEKLREERGRADQARTDLGEAYKNMLALETILAYVGPLQIQRSIERFRANITRVGLQSLILPIINVEEFRNMTRLQAEETIKRVKDILSDWKITIP